MNKIISALCIAAILICNIPTMPAKAVESDLNMQTVSMESQSRTVGLIRKGVLIASASDGKLCINGSTIANDEMKSIGYIDISVEYSSDGVNWYKEKDIDDLLKSNSDTYYLNNYYITVNGGYYYRISCTHYAKEKGLFGSSQSVENTSNSVWID